MPSNLPEWIAERRQQNQQWAAPGAECFLLLDAMEALWEERNATLTHLASPGSTPQKRRQQMDYLDSMAATDSAIARLVGKGGEDA